MLRFLRVAPLVPTTTLLLMGAWLRLFRLTELGLEHDEVANWLIDRAILDGQHGIYFSQAYGHEAGYHYIQTLFVALLGDNALALRLPTAFLGIILLAIVYVLAKRLYNRPIALLSTLIIAITFFPTFYSRLALRAMLLPVLAGIAGYLFWRAVSHQLSAVSHQQKKSLFLVSPSAVFAGLSIYTYQASRAVPIFFLVFFGYLLLWQRGIVRRKWRELLLFGVIYGLIVLPLVLFLRGNPSAEFRTSEVDLPLRLLLEGDFSLIWDNFKVIVGSFGWTGDPLWRQNVAGEPIFNPLTAILFYGGVAIALWRRKMRDIFCLLWLAVATIPSLVTVDAPSTIRMINILPVLGIFPALFIHNLSTLSTKYPHLSTTFWRISWISGLTIVFLWGIGRNLYFTHTIWPNNDEVQFVWQTAFTKAARYLENASDTSPVAIMGWSPDTMDEPTMQLSLRRDDLSLRYFGHELPFPMDVVIIPNGGNSRIIQPSSRTFHPMLNVRLREAGDFVEEGEFNVYGVSAEINPNDITQTLPFSDELLFLGYDHHCEGATCDLLTYWRVLRPVTESRSLFLHVVSSENVFSQSDGLAAPSRFWQTGDILIKHHAITLPPDNAPHQLRLGVYHPQTFQRLLTPEADFVILTLP